MAEDDSGVLELLVTRLELAGYRTFAARDGFKALDLIYATHPQGVVLDVGMPMMDGFGVLASLRANPKYRTLPVLMLTSRNDAESVRHAIALGANDYMTKPFDDAKLLNRVAKLVSTRHRTGPAVPLAID